jgi:hypothetical protein
MSNLPISQLPSSSGLTGTEVLPIVQSGTTVQTTAQDIADLSSVNLSEVSEDITPLFDGVYDIGTEEKKWFDGYFTNKVQIGTSSIQTDIDNDLTVDTNLIVQGTVSSEIGDFGNITISGNTISKISDEYVGDQTILVEGDLDIIGEILQNGEPLISGVIQEGTGAGSTFRIDNNNTASGGYSTVSGGRLNISSGFASTIGGGRNNCSSGNYSFIGGGCIHTAYGTHSFIGGGQGNTASGNRSTIGGGRYNTASGFYSGILVGRLNTASGISSTIGGGAFNATSNTYSTIGGGRQNTSSGCYSTVGGGGCNMASACNSAILGGICNNTSTCNNAMIVGSCITANRQCTTFVNNLSIVNIPTSSAGLPSGAIWSDLGTLKIVS